MASRETRRRKIVDRGADRLALITGQIRAINPSDSDFFPPPPPLDPLPTVPPIQPPLSPDEKTGRDSVSASPDPVSDDDGGHVEEEPEPVREREAPAEVEPRPDERRRRVNIRVTWSEITSAIAETEESRRLCTVAIAVAVVLSNWELPLLGTFLIKEIISSRPFSVALLTNVTLVVARIFLDDRRKSERPSRRPAKSLADGEIDWIEQAGKALEAVFILQKAMDALLLDFSIYAAIVVCGLSV